MTPELGVNVRAFLAFPQDGRNVDGYQPVGQPER
jgi:hypothetical protein